MSIMNHSLATILDFHADLYEAIERKAPMAGRSTIDHLINRLLLDANHAELLDQYSAGGTIKVDLSKRLLSSIYMVRVEAQEESREINYPIAE